MLKLTSSPLPPSTLSKYLTELVLEKIFGSLMRKTNIETSIQEEKKEKRGGVKIYIAPGDKPPQLHYEHFEPL